MRVCPQGDYLIADNGSRETTTMDHHHCDIVGAAYRHVHFSFKQFRVARQRDESLV